MRELKQAITESTSTLIVLPDEASDKDYLASLQLQKIAPEKIHLVAPEHRESIWQTIFDTPPSKKEFAITINTKLSPIEELRYEKNEDTLTVFLSHKGTFNRGSLSFGEFVPPADLFITIGFPALKLAEQAIEQLPHLGVARHIWIQETPIEAPLEKLSYTAANLLGRLMIRSREDHDMGVLWSFITREDFAKTSSSPTEIPALIQSFSRITSLPDTILVFWQFGDDAGTEGLFWSKDVALGEAVASQFAKKYDSLGFISLGMFNNFIEAETSMRKLLRTLGKGTINP